MICFLYWALVYFIPVSWTKIDSTLRVNWNENFVVKINEIIWKAKEAEWKLEEKLDNPAPNTSRNIEGRMGQ